MGTTERRERDRQRRREDILNTARTLFFDKGFRDTTIDDIARAVELARGTIYLYFENKEEIYATILEEGLDLLGNMIVTSRNDVDDPMTSILCAHDAFMRFHDEYPQYYNVLILDKLQIHKELPPPLKTRLDDKMRAMADWIAGILDVGVTQGIFRPIQVRETAYLLMGMSIGYAHMLDRCCTVDDVFTEREQSRQAMHAFVANALKNRWDR